MKYIWKDPKEDDRIFKQGFIISQPKIQNIDLIKIPNKMSLKERIMHLILLFDFSLIYKIKFKKIYFLLAK